jgi:hypothetical protein
MVKSNKKKYANYTAEKKKRKRNRNYKGEPGTARLKRVTAEREGAKLDTRYKIPNKKPKFMSLRKKINKVLGK